MPVGPNNIPPHQVTTSFEEPRAIVPHLPPWEGGVVAQVRNRASDQFGSYHLTSFSGSFTPSLAQAEQILFFVWLYHELYRGRLRASL